MNNRTLNKERNIEIDNFLVKFPQSFAINPKSDSIWCKVLRKYALDYPDSTCKCGILWTKNNISVTCGSKLNLVSAELVNRFCEEQTEEIDARYLMNRDVIRPYSLEQRKTQLKARYDRKRARSYIRSFFRGGKENAIIPLSTPKETVKWIAENQKKLKNKSTEYERMVLMALPRKFRKLVKCQYPIRTAYNQIYFIDLYFPCLKLAIEVDGGYHYSEEQRRKDEIRDKALRTMNISVARIENEDVCNEKMLQSFISSLKLKYPTKKSKNARR